MAVFQRLCELLHSQQVSFRVTEHEAVFTSEAAAEIRGTSLASGAKALICRADGKFQMFVMPANLRLNSKHVRKQRRAKSLRFASREEVWDLTRLTPGAIPPFGSLFGLPTYCDERLGEESQINFNAGDHARSISMRVSDYLRVEKPTLGEFASAAGAT